MTRDRYFGGDFALKSAFNGSTADLIYSQIPGYGMLDVRVGARTENGRYDVFVWSHNAANTDYYKILGTASPFSGLVDGIPGDPVMFGMTIRVRI